MNFIIPHGLEIPHGLSPFLLVSQKNLVVILLGPAAREKIILIEKYINAKPWYNVTPLVFTEERQCRTIKSQAIHKMIIGMYGSK